MEIILLLLPLFAVIIVANILVLRSNRVEQLLFHVFLFLINIPVLIIGLLLMALPSLDLAAGFEEFGFTLTNLSQIGLVVIVMAGWGMLVSITPVRQLLARILPLDPTSSVHTLALILAGYLVGQGALTLSQEGLLGLVESTEPVTVALIVGTELLFIIVAFLGVGFLIRRKGRSFIKRLGLSRPPLIHFAAAGAIIVGLVILQAVGGAIWAFLNPDQAKLLEDVNNLLLADVDSLWKWSLLALASGIGEELLFRGAIQPVFGLGFTSILFALLHVQYGYTPFMLVILILAFSLGLVRRYFSTTVAIIVHVGYNFVLGIIALLATYLQQVAS
ncbi:MAG: hypothetical protein BMS9Abin02_0781 [Anaerolineae bacterium]|nr:MAG: hypothetical protein BMS9Abin02_0781 [Anaerolineae bacterium]